MAKTWVLDTATKGTGAEVLPYEKTLHRPRHEPELALVKLGGSPAIVAEEEAPREPRRFKVVNVMTSQVIAEDVSLREAIDALGALSSVLDARISVWSPEQRRWRLLTLGQARALWDFRDRLAHVPEPSAGPRR
jgi:hypothetical protein